MQKREDDEKMDDLWTRCYSLSCNWYVARRAMELKFISQSQSHGNFHYFYSWKKFICSDYFHPLFLSASLPLTLYASISVLMFISSFSVNSCIVQYRNLAENSILSGCHFVVFFICLSISDSISVLCMYASKSNINKWTLMRVFFTGENKENKLNSKLETSVRHVDKRDEWGGAKMKKKRIIDHVWVIFIRDLQRVGACVCVCHCGRISPYQPTFTPCGKW